MASTINHSSGDLIADRRAAYAEMLAESGDHAAAAELMAGVVELVPDWTAGWFRLGELLEASGDAKAGAAFERALALDTTDRLGARLKLALLGARPLPDQPPTGFVEQLFDQYADRFDESLVEKLAYRVPELLDQAIRERGPGRFARALDLGCGTGLMGERLRPYCEDLTGIDLSEAMLKRAADKRVYDALIKGDIGQVALDGPFDLVTAADVFMYVGALDAIFDIVSKLLAPGGLFAFSVERSEGDDLLLRPSRRYAHSEAYIRSQLEMAGLGMASLSEASIRMDRGEPITGLIVVSAKLQSS